jgi:tripartite-type tricarboxylate transporter receptor subunit TctC
LDRNLGSGTADGMASAREPVSFQGKQILMVIGYAAGGGADTAGRA